MGSPRETAGDGPAVIAAVVAFFVMLFLVFVFLTAIGGKMSKAYALAPVAAASWAWHKMKKK